MEKNSKIDGVHTVMDFKDELYDLYKNGGPPRFELRGCGDVERWGIIREHYKFWLPHILESSKKNLSQRVNTGIDWTPMYSHIEKHASQSIKSERRSIPLYPQFPVFNNFIDFANPYLKIGIELDSNWHKKEKDMERDGYLANYGWIIFRILSSECYYDFDIDNEDDEIRYLEIEKWMKSCDGVIHTIGAIFFGKVSGIIPKELALESLIAHCSPECRANLDDWLEKNWENIN
jgi:very-short-patch-repair endonuclease